MGSPLVKQEPKTSYSSGPKGLAPGESGARIPENCDLWASGGRVSQWVLGFDGLGPGSAGCGMSRFAATCVSTPGEKPHLFLYSPG